LGDPLHLARHNSVTADRDQSRPRDLEVSILTHIKKPAPVITDLIGNPLLKEWERIHKISADTFIRRRRLCSLYAWSVPTEAAIKAIVRCSCNGLISIGAGSGYWEKLISDAGVDVLAYDDKPPALEGGNVYGHKFMYFHVRRGTHRKIPVPTVATLFLAWPPYDQSLAYLAAKRHTGKYIIYVGEGSGGCTGDESFHRYLENNFECIEQIELPQWAFIHDRLEIYERKA
jgi:hypothetical protein